MNTREFALVAFSILTQMAVGTFIVLTVVRFFAKRQAGSEEADRLTTLAYIAVVPIMALALLASLLHLGHPATFYRGLLHITSSWLSREGVMSMVFLGVAFILALLQWRKIGSASLRDAIAVIGALLGLVLVYSMSRIYQMRTVPVWNSFATPVSFFVTSLLLGTLGTGAAFAANYGLVKRQDPGCEEAQCTLMRKAARWLVIAGIALLGVEFLVLPTEQAYLASLGGAAAQSASMMIGEFGVVYVLRLLLVFVGAGILGVFIYKIAANAGREKMVGYLMYSAFGLVLVSEVLGRFLFYATYARLGF